MELQRKKYSCGPAAVRAALYVLGHNITEAALCKWAGTTPEGTDERGLIRAIEHYSHKIREFEAVSFKDGWRKLTYNLNKGHPVVLCVDDNDHWIAAVGRLGAKIIIFDPAPKKYRGKKYSGIRPYSEQEFSERWRYVDDETNKVSYYGLVVL